MRTALLAFLGSTAFITAAAAQQEPQATPPIVPQGTIDAKAAIAECERLAIYLEQARPANPGVTLDQVHAWRQASQAQPCQDNLRRLVESGSAASASAPQTAPASPDQNAGPTQTSALPSPGFQAVKASDLEKLALYNARGEKMGAVHGMLIGPDNKTYILIGHGGFLGLGEKQIALPSDQIAMRGDRLIAETLTDDEIRALPEFKRSADFKEMEGDQTTSLRLMQ